MTETFDYARVKAWAKSSPRQRANLSFTSGVERDVAYLIEDLSEAATEENEKIKESMQSWIDYHNKRADDLQKELDEQCWLLGMSSEREAKLLTVIRRMREALEKLIQGSYGLSYGASEIISEVLSEADKVLGEL